MLKGSITALVTPFKNGDVDYDTFQKLTEWNVKAGSHGLVVCGATGESATLTDDERNKLISACQEVTKGKIPLVVGAGTSSTHKTISYSQQAQKLGANGVLIATPYYNKPTQEGIYQHFKALNDAINIPIYLYNVPARTVVNISDETIARVAQLSNIKGLKDCSGDLTRPIKLNGLLGKKDFTQLTGEDELAYAFNTSGGQGAISITSNIVPELCAQMQNYCLQNNYKEALAIHSKLMPLHAVMTCESNPIPVKYALSLIDKLSPEMRLPLVELQPTSKARVEAAMKQVGLI
jgi:4-hydroxy-tetrahydrodipicolinate synthase